MKEEVISQITGLSLQQALQANTREYGEPISWLGVESAKQVFIQWLEEQGGHVLQGGRFLHLSGFCDKGKALAWLTEEYKKQQVQQDEKECTAAALKTIAIGDSENDVAMLEAAGCTNITATPVNLTKPGNRIHEMGSARMGRDRDTSVLNGWCQAHDVPNLFITDGSFMTSAACQNPSLTYMAFSARAAHYAADLIEQGVI